MKISALATTSFVLLATAISPSIGQPSSNNREGRDDTGLSQSHMIQKKTRRDYLQLKRTRMAEIDMVVKKMENSRIGGFVYRKDMHFKRIVDARESLEDARTVYLHLKRSGDKNWERNDEKFIEAMNTLEIKFYIARKYYE